MSTSQVYFDGQVADGLNLAHEYVDGYLGLRGVTSNGRVDLHGSSVKGIASLKYATVEELYGWGIDVGSVLQMEWAAISGDTYLCGGSAEEVRGRGLTVEGTLDLHGFDTERYDLRDTRLGGLTLGGTGTTIDLRGATVDELSIDDLSRYDIRVDAGTWIGAVHEDAPRLDGDIKLTEDEEDLLHRIHERPRFPPHRRDGCVFAYDDLKRDFAMSYHHPVFMNLVQKDAIRSVDDGYYVVRSDAL